MNKINYTIALMLVLLSTTLEARRQWNWPEDSAKARRSASIYPDMMQSGEFENARTHLDWLLEHAPDLNVSIYINGIKLYDSLASHETDPAARHLLESRVLELHDERIQYFGQKASVLKRKAYAAYRLLRDRPEKLIEALAMMDSAFHYNSPDIHEGLFLAYADLIRRSRIYDQILSEQDILMRFDHLLEYFDINVSKDSETETKIFAILLNTIQFDCEMIRSWLVPKLENQSGDTLLAQRIVKMSYQHQCTDEPFFVQVVGQLSATVPSYALLKVLGSKYESSGEFDRAIENFARASQLAEDAKSRFEINMRIARTYQRQGRFSAAKSAALAALEQQPDSRIPYELIGDLWLGSFETCKGGKSRVRDRAVYLVAYQYYEKADNHEKMKVAAEQFPSIEHIFDELMKEGDTLDVVCWSREQVTLQRRQNLSN